MRLIALLLVASQAFGSSGFSPFGWFTWKAPVSSQSTLPTGGNTPGDARTDLTNFNVYVWTGSTWQLDTSPGGGISTIGTFDGNGSAANGLSISGNSLFAQSATASNPGMVNTGAQTMAGNKTFTGNVNVGSASNRSQFNVVQASAGTAFSSMVCATGSFPNWDWDCNSSDTLTFDNPHTNTLALAIDAVGSWSVGNATPNDTWKFSLWPGPNAGGFRVVNNSTNPGDIFDAYASNASTVLFSIDNAGNITQSGALTINGTQVISSTPRLWRPPFQPLPGM